MFILSFFSIKIETLYKIKKTNYLSHWRNRICFIKQHIEVIDCELRSLLNVKLYE